MTRKLYKVTLTNALWGDHWGDVHFVEAESHKQAADFAYQEYNEDRMIKSTVTHIPFAKVESKDSTTYTEKYDGDGTEYFESYGSKRDIFWANVGSAWFPAAIAVFAAVMIAIAIFTK